MKEYKKFWIGLVVLAVLSPLGLYFPSAVKAGSAWGEWSTDEVKEQIGYAPEGMARTADLWKAAMPDYQPRGGENAPLHRQSAFYIISGLFGIVACAGTSFLLARLLKGKET